MDETVRSESSTSGQDSLKMLLRKCDGRAWLRTLAVNTVSLSSSRGDPANEASSMSEEELDDRVAAVEEKVHAKTPMTAGSADSRRAAKSERRVSDRPCFK